MRNWKREAQNIAFLPHFHILNADSFYCVSTEIADNWFGCQNINHMFLQSLPIMLLED